MSNIVKQTGSRPGIFRQKTQIYQTPLTNIVRKFAGKADDSIPNVQAKILQKVYVSSSWSLRANDIKEIVTSLESCNDRFTVINKRERVDHAPVNKVTQAIARDLDACQLLIMFFDENCKLNRINRYEFLYAQTKGKAILPIKVGDIKDLGWLPFMLDDTRWVDFSDGKPVRDLFEEIDDRIQKMFPNPKLILNSLKSAKASTSAAFRQTTFTTVSVPSFQTNYFCRKTEETQILTTLREVARSPDSGCLAVVGEAGSGKTMMLSRVFSDVKNDGLFVEKCKINAVLWLDCLQWSDANLFEADGVKDNFVEKVIQAAEKAASVLDPDFIDSFFDLEGIASYFRAQQRRVLFVLDNFSNGKLLEYLRAQYWAPFYCIVVTRSVNRDDSHLFTKIVNLGEMHEVHVHDMLATTLQLNCKLSRDQLFELSKRCFGSPLLASTVAARFTRCKDPEAEFQSLLSNNKLCDKSCFFDELVRVGISRLDDEFRNSYFAFLLFEPGETVYLEDLIVLWGLDENDEDARIKARGFCRVFKCEGLIQQVRATNNIQEKSTQTAGESDPERQEDVSGGFTLHRTQFDAALKAAALRLGTTAETDCRLLKTVRQRLATGWARVVGFEQPQVSIVFEILIRKRLDLLAKIFQRLDIDDLQKLCALRIASNWKTFIHFLSEQIPFKDCLPFVWQLVEQLGRYEFIKLAKEEDDSGNSLFMHIFQLVDSSIVNIRSRSLPMLASALKPWRHEYCEAKWISVVLESTESNPTLVAAVKDDLLTLESVTEFSEGALIAAARCGRLCAVKAIWALKTPRQQVTPAALSWAARNGHLNVVEFFCENCREFVGAEDEEGWTPIMHSTSNGHLEVARFLAENFKTVTRLPTEQVAMALFRAAGNGHTEAVKFIYANFIGISPLLKDGKARTVMHIAAFNGHLDVVAYLFELGGHLLISSVDERERTALAYAALTGCCDVVRFLYANYPRAVQMEDNEASTPLLIASTVGHFDVAKFLYYKWTEAATRTNQQDWSPLLCAAGGDYLDLAKFMFEKAPDTAKWRECKVGSTPVMAAAAEGHMDIVRYLCKKCPYALQLQNLARMTPLAGIAMTGQLEIVKILYDAYPDAVTIQGEPGMTPLMLAAREGRLDVVKFLYDACPEAAKIVTNKGITPAAVAAENGHLEVAAFLNQENTHISTTAVGDEQN